MLVWFVSLDSCTQLGQPSLLASWCHGSDILFYMECQNTHWLLLYHLVHHVTFRCMWAWHFDEENEYLHDWFVFQSAYISLHFLSVIVAPLLSYFTDLLYCCMLSIMSRNGTNRHHKHRWFMLYPSMLLLHDVNVPNVTSVFYQVCEIVFASGRHTELCCILFFQVSRV